MAMVAFGIVVGASVLRGQETARTLSVAETRNLYGGIADRCCWNLFCKKLRDCDDKDGVALSKLCTIWDDEEEVAVNNDKDCDWFEDNESQ
jgi:hypothetical protein